MTIDPNMAGDTKGAADIDGDGRPDYVVGGKPAEGLKWYQSRTLQRTLIATPRREFSEELQLADIDGDGDQDIVVSDGPDGDNLAWFANPRPGKSAYQGANWQRHVIGSLGDWGKDIAVSDFDHDGRLDVAVRNRSAVLIFF